MEYMFSELQQKVVITKSNPIYRVSDIVLQKGPTWRDAAEKILEVPGKYKNTILYSYLKLNSIDSSLDMQLLNSVINDHGRRCGYAVPRPEDLVLHLRLGDVMEPGHPIGPERINSYLSKFFCWLKDKISKGVNLGFDRLVVCTAINYGGFGGAYDYSQVSEIISRQLLGNALYEAQENGLSIDVKSSSNVDEDLFFMWSSSHLVPSNSEFSFLIANCAALERPTNIYPHVFQAFTKDRKNGKIKWSKNTINHERKFFKGRMYFKYLQKIVKMARQSRARIRLIMKENFLKAVQGNYD